MSFSWEYERDFRRYKKARLNDKEMQQRYGREGFRINTFSVIIDRLSALKHFPKRGYCSSYVCVCGLPPVTVENDRFLVYDELKIIYAQQWRIKDLALLNIEADF